MRGWRRAGAAALLACAQAQAAPQLFEGRFADDDERALFAFTLDDRATLNAQSLGFANGGFATVLSLFANGLGLIGLDAGSSHGCDPTRRVDDATQLCWDAGLSLALEAGHYTLVLTQDGNLPLSDEASGPFLMDGAPDYTGQWTLGVGGRRFVNADAALRDGAWALSLDIGSPLQAPLPSPAPWALWWPLLLLAGRRAGAGRLTPGSK